MTLITFSGLDGSGKSTLIDSREQWLGPRGKDSVIRAVYDHIGIYAWARAARDRGRRAIGRSAPPSVPGNQLQAVVIQDARRSTVGRLFIRIVRSRISRFAALVIDVMLFRLYRRSLERKGSVLITDRYFYDTLVDLTENGSWTGVSFVMRLIPTPDLSVFVDVSPEVAWHRKGEYPPEWGAARRERYLKILSGFKNVVVVANEDRGLAVQDLNTAVVERML